MAIETQGAALQQIHRLFAEGSVTGLSEAQLLERFLAQGDAVAFEALVSRHGPMVLSVCRGVLRNPDDKQLVSVHFVRPSHCQFRFRGRPRGRGFKSISSRSAIASTH